MAFTVSDGMLEGTLFELKFADRAPVYLSRFARRLRRVDPSRLADLLDDAADQGQVTPGERDDAMLADVVLTGRRRGDDAEAYYVVKTSVGVGQYGVSRARERANVLAKLGRPVVPIVAGAFIDPVADTMARTVGVEQMIDPRIWPRPIDSV